MSREQVMQDIRDCINFYEARGWDWADAVSFIAFRYSFGSMHELASELRSPLSMGRPRKPR